MKIQSLKVMVQCDECNGEGCYLGTATTLGRSYAKAVDCSQCKGSGTVEKNIKFEDFIKEVSSALQY